MEFSYFLKFAKVGILKIVYSYKADGAEVPSSATALKKGQNKKINRTF